MTGIVGEQIATPQRQRHWKFHVEADRLMSSSFLVHLSCHTAWHIIIYSSPRAGLMTTAPSRSFMRAAPSSLSFLPHLAGPIMDTQQGFESKEAGSLNIL